MEFTLYEADMRYWVVMLVCCFPFYAASDDLKKIELTPHVLVLQHGPWEETMTALDAGESVVVVDTWSSPEAAARAQTMIQSHFHKPVSHVINTHHHWDHTFGNQVFSGATIVGHRFCAQDMKTEYGDPEKRRASLSVSLARATFQPLIDFIHNIIIETDRDYQLTLPQHLVDDRDVLSIGNLTIKLYHVPGLHTRSNLTVFVPELGLLFTRREFQQGLLPVLEKGADLSKMISSLQDILDSKTKIKYLVVGHGQPIADPDIQPSLSYLKALESVIKQAIENKQSVQDVERGDAFRAFPIISQFLQQHRANLQVAWDSLFSETR
jgi:glyoxylase-like metal-dependent hydrolase (beta-lactamase superfamily II)